MNMTNEEINNIIIQNEKLAYSIAHKYKNKVSAYIEFEDLKSICILGLVKAANTYDYNKNIQFSTYSYSVIRNDILLELKKLKKHRNTINLFDIVDNDKITYIDFIKDELNIEQDYIDNEQLKDLNIYINELPQKFKSTIELSLKGFTQIEISNLLNISQPQISRIYKQAINILRRKFERKEI